MIKENKNKLKVMTIFGTRPEIIRLSRIFAKLDEYVNHIMVHTGQSFDYEMNKIFFDQMDIRQPDYFLEVKSKTLGGQLANIIAKSETVLQKEKPDAVLILGDTNSSLAAIVAKRMKIPIFHMEAGNRCFSENTPEEINRRLIDHISDINLPYTENARLYLIREGIHPGTIYVTGSPLTEVFYYYRNKIKKSSILQHLKLKNKKYFIVSIHREENIEVKEIFLKLITTLNALAEKYHLPIVVTTHPRTAQRLQDCGVKAHRLINFHKPFGYFDYSKLQQNAFCTLSDSGSICEEAAILQIPSVQIRESSERPEAFDEGVTILSGLDKEIILQAVQIVTTQFAQGDRPKIPKNYQDINVSTKVLRLIVGLTKIIRKRRNCLW